MSTTTKPQSVADRAFDAIEALHNYRPATRKEEYDRLLDEALSASREAGEEIERLQGYVMSLYSHYKRLRGDIAVISRSRTGCTSRALHGRIELARVSLDNMDKVFRKAMEDTDGT